MNTAPQMLARQRVRELRKRQVAFNRDLDHVVQHLSAPGGPPTDQTPGQWPELWAAWQAANAILQVIVGELTPSVRK